MQKDYVLENAKVRAIISIDENQVHEKYFSLENGLEIPLAETRTGASFGACTIQMEAHTGNEFPYDYQDAPVVLFDGSPDEYTETPELKVGDPLPQVLFKLVGHKFKNSEGKRELTLHGKSPKGDQLERKITLFDGADHFEISNELELKRNIDLEYFTDYYSFAQGHDPDFTWIPHIKFDPTCITPDWEFKSPSLMIQKKNAALALVPDLDFLSRDKSIMYCSAALDLDITDPQGPKTGYGLISSKPHYHSMFIHPVGNKRPVPKGKIAYKYFLFLDGATPEKQIYRRIVQFLWEKYGHKNFLNGYDAQRKSFNVLEKEGWHWIGRKFWIEPEYNGKKYGGFRDYHRELDDDIWFFGWWNSLRTAYGMEAYARRRNHPETSRKAKAIFNLIADAPRKDGAFPAVFLLMNGKRVWTAGSPSGFGGPIEDYHTFSMSWTAYWLLKWKHDFEKDDPRIMQICTEYAEFLLRNQQSSGFIPSYYRETDLSVDDAMLMNKENAEPAVCALFLVEMFKVTLDHRYLESAEKAVRYVEREIMPENKWFDFETFYSCSPKKVGLFDKITGQYPQCNMALQMLSQVCLDLHRIKANEGYLELGKRALDYLCLYQQVWSHPRMELNLVGGFATQNTDSEWSDSRQSQCAMIFMDYFEETGDRVYLERGIAAMRATLVISPYENWSHRGYNNEPGFFSSFHWGIGTGLTTEEMLVEKYGDVFIELDKGFAYGLNGCTVTNFTLKGDSINLSIISNIHFVTPLKLVFRGTEKKHYKVTVNGNKLGEYDLPRLTGGIDWYFEKQAK